MKTKTKQVQFLSQISVALDNICDNCRRNEKPDIYETSYKPLLLESSNNFVRKRKSQREGQSQGRRGKSRTSVGLMSTSMRSDGQSRVVMTANKPRSVRSFRYPNATSSTMQKMRSTLRTPSQATTTAIFSLTLPNSLSPLRDELTLFLTKLYNAKTRDLAIQPNARQQKIFIARLQRTIKGEDFVAPQCDFGMHSVRVVMEYLAAKRVGRLVLDKNPIGDQGAVKLAGIIPSLQQLTELSLVSINMTSKSGLLLLHSCTGHPSLESLNLSSPEGLNRNRINPEGYSQLSELLSHPLCKLHTLNLANTGMGEQGFLYFCAGFERAGARENCFKVVNLAANQISVAEGNVAYVGACLGNLSVQKLELQGNNFADLGSKMLAHVIGAQYSRNKISSTLLSLNLSSNRLKSYGFEQLCNLLPSNKKLTDLFLDHNDLAENEMFYCTKQLLTYTWSLKRLSLRRTLVAAADSVYHHVKNMAEGLLRNKSIRELDLSENSVQGQGFVQIFQALKENCTLKLLKMESCGIADSFLQKAEPIMRENKSLTTLNLNNNFINEPGAQILIKLLSHSHNLTQLSIKKNCITGHTLNQIAYQLRENKNSIKPEDPEYQYISYIMGLQEEQKKNILAAIQELDGKVGRVEARGIAIEVVGKLEKIGDLGREIQVQRGKIGKLEGEIEKEREGRKRNTTTVDGGIQHGESFLVTN